MGSFIFAITNKKILKMKKYSQYLILLFGLFYVLLPYSWCSTKAKALMNGTTCSVPDVFQLIPGASSCQVKLSFHELNSNYQFRYRIKGRNVWETQTTRGATLYLAGLQPCTDYEFQLRQDCFNNQFSGWSALQSIKTQGCNEQYCLAYATKNDGFIEQFSLGDLEYFSGNDGGLGLHFKQVFIAQVGSELPFSIKPVKTIEFYDPDPYTRVYYTIFIDFNRDKDFDDPGEYVFKDEGATDKLYSWKLAIPKTATFGLTRMRVIMSRKTLGKACERSINILEVEDYLLGIFNPCTPLQYNDFRADTIESGRVHLRFAGENTGYNWRYRAKTGGAWILPDSTNAPQISISGLVQNTEYEVQIRNSCGGGNWSLFSKSFLFKTSTCTVPSATKWNTYFREKSRVGLEILGLKALNYRWRYSLNSRSWSPIFETKTPRIELDSLTAETVYQIEVSIECSAGNWSDWSKSSFFTWGECKQISSNQISIGIDLNFRSDFIILTSKMEAANQFFWRFRKLGTTQWFQLSTNRRFYDWYPLSTEYGVTYEWQVSYVCENGQQSEWSEVKQIAFSPKICAPAQTKFVTIKRVTANKAILYADIPYGVQFSWQWREKGTTVFWSNFSGSSYANKEITLSKLKPNTTYEYQFRYWCTNSTLDWSDIGSFKTLNAFPIQLNDSTRVSSKYPLPHIPIVVSPNPNEGVFKVESVFKNPQHVHLTLRDLMGRVVYREELKDQIFINETIQLATLVSGTYLLEIKTAEYSTIEKIIIKQP
jgi:chitodextrinase